MKRVNYPRISSLVSFFLILPWLIDIENQGCLGNRSSSSCTRMNHRVAFFLCKNSKGVHIFDCLEDSMEVVSVVVTTLFLAEHN